MLTGESVVQNFKPLQSDQQGVALLEALIAILIFSVGVLAIVGLQAFMLKNTSDSKYRADASYIAQQRIGTMWADPANAATYLEPGTDISTLLPNGIRTVTQEVPGRYVITVTWQLPGEVRHNFTTVATIAGG
jgi:type IV pilus assembly protein PilV